MNPPMIVLALLGRFHITELSAPANPFRSPRRSSKNNETRQSQLNKILPSNRKIILKPAEPLTLKLIYGREDHSVELHMQIE